MVRKNLNNSKIIVQNSIWVFANKIVTQIFALIVSILVLRKLAVDDYGVFNFLVASYVIFEVFAIAPLTSVFNRYIPEFISHGDHVRLNRLVIEGGGGSIVIVSVLSSLIWIFRSPFGAFFHLPDFSGYFIAYIVYVWFAYLRALMISVVTSLLLHKSLAIVNIIQSALSPLLYLFFLPVLTVKLMLLIEAVLSICIFVPCVFILVRFTRSARLKGAAPVETNVSKKRLVRFFTFSFFNELGAGFLGKTSEYFIVSAISNQFYVGLYSFAYRIYSIVFRLLPIQEFLTIIRPIFIQKFSGDYDRKEFIQIYNFMVKIMLVIYGLPAIYFLFYGREVISIVFTPKYLDAYWTTCVVLTTNLCVALFYPQGLTIILKERIEIALYSKLVVVFTILAGIFAMQRIGIVGLAMVSLVGEYSKNLFMHYMMKKDFGDLYRLVEYRNFLLYIASLVVLLYPMRYLIHGTLSLAIVTVLFMGGAILLLILMHPFNSGDILLLKKLSASTKPGNYISPIIEKIHIFRPVILNRNLG